VLVGNAVWFRGETFMADESTVATCRCTQPSHAPHKGGHCQAPATEPDGYCLTCHEIVEAELKWTTDFPRPQRRGADRR
jgi:hypothetical protein